MEMKNRLLVVLTAVCVVCLTGCGRAEDIAEAVETAVANETADGTTDNNTSGDKGDWIGIGGGGADDMVGEWEFVYQINHTEYSESESYEYIVMLDDDYAPKSTIIVRKDGDRYITDYRFETYEGSAIISGSELTIRKGEPYAGASDTDWYAQLYDPFADESEDGYYRNYSMTDDGRLVVSFEYLDEYDTEDGYEESEYYYSLEKNVYMRKGSPELDDPEQLRYFDTVTVSDADELLDSIQSNRRIIMQEGIYDISSVDPDRKDYSNIGEGYYRYQINNASNLCLEAAEGADVTICIDDAYEPVLAFGDARNITLKNLIVGHSVEPGYCTGSVLYFANSDGIDIENCKLYGSGTYGVEASFVYDITVRNTEIYECTYGLVSLSSVSHASFEDCVMRDSSDLSMIYAHDSSDVLFDRCDFNNNRADAFDTVYFVELGEYDRITFRDCSFWDNKYYAFSNREVTLENCTTDSNRALFAEMMGASATDKTSILNRYDESLARQKEIDAQFENEFLNQSELNDLAYEEYAMWDSLLNSVWTYISDRLDEQSMDSLRSEQRQWIREKEKSMEDAVSGFEGGTMAPLVSYSTGAGITHSRVEELIEHYVR